MQWASAVIFCLLAAVVMHANEWRQVKVEFSAQANVSG